MLPQTFVHALLANNTTELYIKHSRNKHHKYLLFIVYYRCPRTMTNNDICHLNKKIEYLWIMVSKSNPPQVSSMVMHGRWESCPRPCPTIATIKYLR